MHRLAAVLIAGVGLLIAAQPVAARDYDCSDFSTHRQAQRFFMHHNPRRDPFRLDADHDGIACESLP